MNIRYLTYRFEWWLRGFIRFNWPIHIDIELNNNCNQHCISCWHSKPDDRKFDIAVMSYDDIERILTYFSKTAKSVKFNLRGEPSLAKTILASIRLAKDLGYVDTMINTNMTMPKEILCEIITVGIDTIIASVDSFDEETYCKLHGCSEQDFGRVIGNLKYAKSLIKEKKLKTRLRINYHRNIYNVDDDMALYKKYFSDMPLVIRDTEKREGSDISNKPKRKKRKRFCPHMNRRVTHLANGKVYPCCVCYNEPDDIQIGIKGYVSWGKRIELFRRYDADMPQSCRECTSADIWR